MNPRKLLLNSFRAAVAAADPLQIVPGHLPAPPKGRTLVVGAGKAAAAMARAVENHWPKNAALDGLVITRYGHSFPGQHKTGRIQVIEAGHPVPDEQGEAAARKILAQVKNLGADDLLLVTEWRKRRLQPLQQRRQAAEVAQAGAHFEQHGVGAFVDVAVDRVAGARVGTSTGARVDAAAVRSCGARIARRLEHDHRREGERRMRDRLQRLGIAPGIGHAERELRRQRQRGGALHRRLHAECPCRRVDGKNRMRIQQRHRPVAGTLWQGRDERLERKQRQVNGNPDHGGFQSERVS